MNCMNHKPDDVNTRLYYKRKENTIMKKDQVINYTPADLLHL